MLIFRVIIEVDGVRQQISADYVMNMDSVREFVLCIINATLICC